MPTNIRKATADDEASWVQLLREVLGKDPEAERAYDLNRASGQLIGPQVEETWVAEINGRLYGSLCILASGIPNNNPVANLGRYLALPANYQDGTAELLIEGINQVCLQRQQMAVLRVPASDLVQQRVLEKLGYVCVGFQPLKLLCLVRESALFYLRVGAPNPSIRLPLSQSLPQIAELATSVLTGLNIPNSEIVRDGLTGYPLQTDLTIDEYSVSDYETCRSESGLMPLEISGYYNRGLGLLRVDAGTPLQAWMGRRGDKMVAGLAGYFDEHDKCLRIIDSFAADELSPGALLHRAVQIAQERFNAVYVEVDFLITARRALKTAEQLGFVPVAYLPGFYNDRGCCLDVVKLVKLNAMYSLESAKLTPFAQTIVDIVDHNFQDQKVGVAVINLLRSLAIFQGLGDGELGKLARLFSQKLYRAGERVFGKGDSSSEAYVVMRGQIDVRLADDAPVIASIGNGQILGEQAFLDGSPRTAGAVAAQPIVVLVVQRPAFNELIHSEPHLGMVVMRNIALEVSNKLRKASAQMAKKDS